MTISARDRLKGKIVEVKEGGGHGACPDRYRRRINRPASITNEVANELGLAVGGGAYAVVKASDVMIAID
jgi:molybdopterin-binding protein